MKPDQLGANCWRQACTLCSDCGVTTSEQWFRDCTMCHECKELHDKGETCPVCDVAYVYGYYPADLSTPRLLRCPGVPSFLVACHTHANQIRRPGMVVYQYRDRSLQVAIGTPEKQRVSNCIADTSS